MPEWKSVIRERIASLHLEGPAEADLIEELAQHLEDRYRELCSGGTNEHEAFQIAISGLNDVYPLRAKSARMQQSGKYDAVPAGDSRPASFLEDFWRDLRYAGRAMRKSPTFVVFVVLTLALGIGANTTVFTVINTLILNPLPVPKSSELVAVNAARAGNSSKSSAPLPLSYADLKDIQARNTVFRSLAGYTSAQPVTWQAAGASEGMFVELVTGNYFSTLGLKPTTGRFFLSEEDATPGAHAVAVMNYGTWQTRFGGTTDIIGKTLRLNHIVFTVIGVAPPHSLE